MEPAAVHMSAPAPSRCKDLVAALEEERRRISVFQRELPLCLHLVNQAIENYKQGLAAVEEEEETTTMNAGGPPPALEEFIPLKPSSFSLSEDDDDDKQCEGRLDCFRSIQLWNNQNPNKVVLHKPVPVHVKKSSGGSSFRPYDREKIAPPPPPPSPPPPPPSAATNAGSSSAETSVECHGEEKEKEAHDSASARRKIRRCWSPELHRRFLQALQQLGGSQAATPKQIRELMKVDSLTNDEVKSHLQKYRLHTRRPNRAVKSNPNSHTQQTPQFVVVGGIWVPPAEYAAIAATTTLQPTTGAAPHLPRIYAPVAKLPNEGVIPKKHEGSPLAGIVTNSESPATSSTSSRTTVV